MLPPLGDLLGPFSSKTAVMCIAILKDLCVTYLLQNKLFKHNTYTGTHNATFVCLTTKH